MYKEVINLLRCPICRDTLELSSDFSTFKDEVLTGILKCHNGHNWNIADGIADFGTQKQDFQQDINLSELEATILDKTPKNLLKIYRKAAKDIARYIGSTKPKYIIDISTGLGMHIAKVLQKTNLNTHIICTDLNYNILKYNRYKTQNAKNNIKISYISCDPINLPFVDNAFDLATSFFGIANMVNFAPNGLEEANRVLNNDKFLINTCMIVNTNSKGYTILKEFISTNNLNPGEKFITLDGVKSIHNSKNFKNVKIKMIDDGIGEKNEVDLLPFENEWFGILNVYCRK